MANNPAHAAGGFFGTRYFLNLIGPPSAALLAGSLGAAAVPGFRGALATFCHQIVARSLCIDGRPMGLCARCTGIYLGIAATWAGIGVLARRPLLFAVLEQPSYALAAASVLLWVLGVEVENPARFAFGLSLGTAGAFLLWRARQAIDRFSPVGQGSR